jgi:hypothetical protein
MLAFDTLFLDRAKREYRVLQLFSVARERQTFVLRELYCSEPGCDCRRVVLVLEWVERNQIAATIDYAFDPSGRRDDPQFFLDPRSPQSELSEELLDCVRDLMRREPEYREQLIDHYLAWKRAVDARVRAARPPKRRSAARPRGPAPAALELVRRGTGRSDSKASTAFRRLIKKVDELKRRLASWRDAQPGIRRELATYRAECEQRHGRARDLLLLLDAAHDNPALTKTERRKLSTWICGLARDAIEAGDDDLKPLYARHAKQDFDAEVAEEDAARADALRAMMEMHGVDFGDADVSSTAKLREFLADEVQAEQQAAAAEAERRARRKKTAKQAAREAERAEQARNADKALQEIYRKLAVALHPDLEQDPQERARKTALMQEINVAYEAKDLLKLLELQLRFEQIDRDRVDAVADDRLRHYNRVLEEQAKQLASELAELEAPFRIELDVAPSAVLSSDRVIAQIRFDTSQVVEQRRVIETDIERFRDMGRLKQSLSGRRKQQGRRPNSAR